MTLNTIHVDLPSTSFHLHTGHAESYNPPPEYLPTKEEEQEWLAAHPDDRKRDFLPKRWVYKGKSVSKSDEERT